MRIAKVLVIAILIISTAFTFYHLGIRHAIEDSVIWTVTRYDPENPVDWNGYDQEIFIDLDGQTYSHGMIQG